MSITLRVTRQRYTVVWIELLGLSVLLALGLYQDRRSADQATNSKADGLSKFYRTYRESPESSVTHIPYTEG